MNTLYLVATPIGNLEDITARAVRVLREVDLIAAEDTRLTQRLLNHLSIQNTLTSFHEHNKLSKLDKILGALVHGDVALVSDAGTPALNDPGFLLVREVIKNGHQVSPIPGPCAPVAALVSSGLPTDKFMYLGYLPRKSSERKRFLEDIERSPLTQICLETPHRLPSSLQDLLEVLGDRQIAIARELTKLHEEIMRGKISEAIKYFDKTVPRGEFTLVVAGASKEQKKWTTDEVRTRISESLSMGKSSAEIAKRISAMSGWPRRDVYKLITKTQNEGYD